VFDCAIPYQHPVKPSRAIECWRKDPDATGIFGGVVFAREAPYVVHMDMLNSDAAHGFTTLGSLQENAIALSFLATVIRDFDVPKCPEAYVS
jgi:hypothetical protein